MLMDVFSFGVGAFVGTIMSIGIIALMVTGKQADEQISNCPFVNCKSDCIDWPKCERYCRHDN